MGRQEKAWLLQFVQCAPQISAYNPMNYLQYFYYKPRQPHQPIWPTTGRHWDSYSSMALMVIPKRVSPMFRLGGLAGPRSVPLAPWRIPSPQGLLIWFQFLQQGGYNNAMNRPPVMAGLLLFYPHDSNPKKNIRKKLFKKKNIGVITSILSF